MNRRKFIKSIGSGVAALLVPVSAVGSDALGVCGDYEFPFVDPSIWKTNELGGHFYSFALSNELRHKIRSVKKFQIFEKTASG